MVHDIFRFYREALADLQAPDVDECTLDDYVTDRRYSSAFSEDHLYPMASAIWSTPLGDIGEYPAKALLQFFRNHGLLQVKGRPKWKTVRGGSHTYVRRMIEGLRGQIRVRTQPATIRRLRNGVEIAFQGGSEEFFDAVVIGTHADEALAMLADPSPEERRLLGAWRYEPNRTVLHTHREVLPPRKRAWASWNFRQPSRKPNGAPVSVTYYMNMLQNLPTDTQYFVSLNHDSVPDEAILMETTYTHPTYSFASLATQAELPDLNGRRHTWYCGSYFGYGFHEDAVRSGVGVARDFGIDL
jgi:predicted NAD/FAD-binding protein